MYFYMWNVQKKTSFFLTNVQFFDGSANGIIDIASLGTVATAWQTQLMIFQICEEFLYKRRLIWLNF